MANVLPTHFFAASLITAASTLAALALAGPGREEIVSAGVFAVLGPSGLVLLTVALGGLEILVYLAELLFWLTRRNGPKRSASEIERASEAGPIKSAVYGVAVGITVGLMIYSGGVIYFSRAQR